MPIVKSFKELEQKNNMITSTSYRFLSGPYEAMVQEWVQKAEKQGLVKRLWGRDATLWKKSPKDHAEIVSRLGWLSIVHPMKDRAVNLKAFADEIRKEGIAHIVLLGMGGSSLAPEVFQTVSGNKPGYPELLVLDSTDPLKVRDIQEKIDLGKSLFVVSSKSGGTIELISFYKYFFEKVKAVEGDKAGQRFVAITDPGSPLEKLAKENNFRRVFLAPEDVGGRFSALTYFGLVPAALIGADIDKILRGAEKMMDDSSLAVTYQDNSSLVLGIAMAVLAEEGRDKLTLVTPENLESFGDWAEQLVAESTGKEEVGIVPVVRERLEKPEAYGNDRFFVALVPRNLKNIEEFEARLNLLAAAGHPVLILTMRDAYDLGAEFFRWEYATAVACSLLKINAFDQPDVQAAKNSAKAILKKLEETGELPVRQTEISLDNFWENADTGNYVAVLAFLPDRREVKARLGQLIGKIRNSTKLAATLGFGPRYLHSTGQLHKGGANNGIFILITAAHTEDLPVPGEKYSFAQLELAQAMGDFEALETKGRWLVHLRAENDTEKSLNDVCEKIEAALTALQGQSSSQ